ncbi:MAG: EutP/PduV family microcompartment system protein [Veillonella parvula]
MGNFIDTPGEYMENPNYYREHYLARL